MKCVPFCLMLSLLIVILWAARISPSIFGEHATIFCRPMWHRRCLNWPKFGRRSTRASFFSTHVCSDLSRPVRNSMVAIFFFSFRGQMLPSACHSSATLKQILLDCLWHSLQIFFSLFDPAYLPVPASRLCSEVRLFFSQRDRSPCAMS